MEKKLIIDSELAMFYIKNSEYNRGYKDNIIFKFKPFSKRDQLYSFTNENQGEYYKLLDFNDKKVLTVAASADHAFNAILHGAEKVDTFDINRLTSYYVDLKKVIIETKNYQTFMTFFGNDYRFIKPFNIYIYKDISDLLMPNSKLFWDTLYSYTTGSDIKKHLFKTQNEYIINNMNSYLNEENYYRLQDKISSFKINFIESNILNLDKKVINEGYDLILLSNISDYIEKMFSFNQLVKFRELILKLGETLNENGQIVFAYIYDIDGITHRKIAHNFNNKKKREKAFNEPHYQTLYFDSVVREDAKDAIMVYTKK